MTITEENVRSFLLERLEPQLRQAGREPAALSDETDLFTAGVIDSLAIVELVSVVSDRYGIDDWEDYDPEDLLVIGPFCRYVARRAVTDTQIAG
jgi:acyl carrier protein